jgi:hypothetical protein
MLGSRSLLLLLVAGFALAVLFAFATAGLVGEAMIVASVGGALLRAVEAPRAPGGRAMTRRPQRAKASSPPLNV